VSITTTLGLEALVPSPAGSGLPERAGARVLPPRVPRGRLRNAPCPSQVTGLVISPTPSSARTITGPVRILTRSRPQAMTPHLLLASAGLSRPVSGTREGLDAEETRSPITQHRADNSRRVGDPPLGREQASEGDGYLATGRRLGHRAAIRGKAAPRSMTPAERAIQDGTEPGHLTSRRAWSKREAGGALGRRANGTKVLASTAEVREEARAGRPNAILLAT
jgi:hypothetical protein